jgi:hypothetical protein
VADFFNRGGRGERGLGIRKAGGQGGICDDRFNLCNLSSLRSLRPLRFRCMNR